VARLARRIASFPADEVRTAKQVLNDLTMLAADAIRADARRFRQLVAADPAQGRTAALFARACRPAGRSNSTSASASEPFDTYTTRIRPEAAGPVSAVKDPLATRYHIIQAATAT
jgi:hypothetical protein